MGGLIGVVLNLRTCAAAAEVGVLLELLLVVDAGAGCSECGP
jgi:hypothetical protein